MALKGQPRSRRTKRLSNVSDDFKTPSDEMNFSSTDTDVDEPYKPRKVRDNYSIKELMKRGENFKIDSDHIYTCGKSSKDLETLVVGRRRKRNSSEESDQKITKQRCFSKNALMAKLNRERKKAYVSNLETQNEKLQIEVNEINKKIQLQDKMISSMKHEISYLKGLLANSKEIGQILQNLKSATGLPVTSSLKVRNCEEQEDCIQKNQILENNRVKLNPPAKSVNCGFAFPIVKKDINLGSSSDMSVLNDLESSFFDFNNDEIETAVPSLETDMLSYYDSNLNNYNPDMFLKGEDAIDGIPSAGICLHVNKERISVEFCSICNSKAGLLVPESPSDSI